MGDVKLNKISQKIGFIGGGNMAKAICEGMVQKGLIKYSQVYVSGPRPQSLQFWSNNGANISTQNAYPVVAADVIFLAVKPHILPAALKSMYEQPDISKCADKLFISIISGTSIEKLEEALSNIKGSKVIRTMPNTSLRIGHGCTVYTPGTGVSPTETAIVKSVFEPLGLCTEVPENMISTYGALAGSGPAYIYVAIEALSDAGVKLGIPRDLAIKFAAQTVAGAGKMVLETAKHPAVLKDEVCSPAGSTICAIHALEKGGFRACLINAVESAYQRTEEVQRTNN